ncbi:MAG: hypothetical protein EPN97_00670 [Alphaproteobacteria bacterium]|nr:MAG: hypothetical protein EPN97_00670 [Alphaproteobacteria bacterium]
MKRTGDLTLSAVVFFGLIAFSMASSPPLYANPPSSQGATQGTLGATPAAPTPQGTTQGAAQKGLSTSREGDDLIVDTGQGRVTVKGFFADLYGEEGTKPFNTKFANTGPCQLMINSKGAIVGSTCKPK